MIESGRIRVGRACVVSGALASELLLGGHSDAARLFARDPKEELYITLGDPFMVD